MQIFLLYQGFDSDSVCVRAHMQVLRFSVLLIFILPLLIFSQLYNNWKSVSAHKSKIGAFLVLPYYQCDGVSVSFW